MNSDKSKSTFLRKALLANAIFSGTCGIAVTVAARPLGDFLRLPGKADLTALGISLAVYAVILFAHARRAVIPPAAAWLFVILDMAWVAGSAALIFSGLLSPGGNGTVALVADVVLAFALLQAIGVAKIRQDAAPREKLSPHLTL